MAVKQVLHSSIPSCVINPSLVNAEYLTRTLGTLQTEYQARLRNAKFSTFNHEVFIILRDIVQKQITKYTLVPINNLLWLAIGAEQEKVKYAQRTIARAVKQLGVLPRAEYSVSGEILEKYKQYNKLAAEDIPASQNTLYHLMTMWAVASAKNNQNNLFNTMMLLDSLVAAMLHGGGLILVHRTIPKAKSLVLWAGVVPVKSVFLGLSALLAGQVPTNTGYDYKYEFFANLLAMINTCASPSKDACFDNSLILGQTYIYKTLTI